jgi:murein DD-endopeptidase MepM/ murein hydrolase activator NlpD
MFSRPVDTRYPIKTYYGEKDRRYTWSIDSDNGLWLPVRDSQGFGNHRGTDFDCPPGTIVRAMADGFIIRSRYEDPLDTKIGAGLHILQLVNLPGFDSWVLKYSHLRAVYVRPGHRIARHDPIALSGNTGDALSPYLHVDLQNIQHQWRAVQLESF